MTQNMERTTDHAGADREEPPAHSATGAVSWWRRPWIIPLALVVAGFLVYQLSPFAHLQEDRAPIPPHDGFPLYWPILLAHMALGTVAMVTVVLQVWPWLRRRHPAIHRISGRTYVVASIVSGVLALIIVPFAPVVGQVGVSMATLVWIGTSAMGIIRARQGRYAEHRRFMLYSFAVVMNNVWGVVIVGVGLRVPIDIDMNYLLEAARWVGWVVNLMLVQWWLNRTADRTARLRAARARARRTTGEDDELEPTAGS